MLRLALGLDSSFEPISIVEVEKVARSSNVPARGAR